MRTYFTTKTCFWLCKIIGVALLFAHWVTSGQIANFFLLLILVILTLARWRIGLPWFTVALDAALLWWFDLPIFMGFFIVPEVFLQLSTFERRKIISQRDEQAGRYYAMERLQNELAEALGQIERMTAVAERTRIARDIHDNAGHEIVAAYMSFQTIRSLLDDADQDVLELYDAALGRLDQGADRIREAVHNLSAVRVLGVETLEEICAQFTAAPVSLLVHGNTEKIPIYVWNMLDACTRECLTNVTRHAEANFVTLSLDVTNYLVRLCIENDGVIQTNKKPGSGMRNLRQRAAAIGGSLTMDAGELFRVVCVVPLKEEWDETINCG